MLALFPSASTRLAGVGKSFIVTYITEQMKNLAVTAMTGAPLPFDFVSLSLRAHFVYSQVARPF